MAGVEKGREGGHGVYIQAAVTRYHGISELVIRYMINTIVAQNIRNNEHIL